MPARNVDLTAIQIAPQRVRLALVLAIVALAALGTLAYALYWLPPLNRSPGVVEIAKRLDMDHEINLPTWFSSSCLLVCSLLLGAIALATRKSGRPYAWHWALLALVFLYLSLDETANLHEILIVPIRRRLGLGGFLYFAWVLPGFAAVAALGLAYLRFVGHLDARSRWRFIYAACVYIAGAMGMELVGGAMADWHGLESLPYVTVMMAEEVLEMLGLVIFIHALLDYIRLQFGAVQWVIRGPAASGG